MADPAVRRRRWSLAGIVALAVGALVLAVWTDVDARTRSRNEQASLAAANAPGLAPSPGSGDRFAAAVDQGPARLAAGLDRLDDEPTRRRQRVLWPTPACTPSCKASASTPCRPAWAASRARSGRSRPRTTRRRPRTSRPSQVRARSWPAAPTPAWCTRSTFPTRPSCWWAVPTTPTQRTRWRATSRSSTPRT